VTVAQSFRAGSRPGETALGTITPILYRVWQQIGLAEREEIHHDNNHHGYRNTHHPQS
jgi:hypothetical protein